MDSRQNGISLTDALIAIFILSASAILFTKNWTSSFGAKNSTHMRSVASAQISEIGNILLAHISDLNKTTPANDVRRRVQVFSVELSARINNYARAKGYQCNGNKPQILNPPDTSINLNEATLPKIWAGGAASCIDIKVMPGIKTETNGVWVRIEASWIDSHTREGHEEHVSVYSLVSPL